MNIFDSLIQRTTETVVEKKSNPPIKVDKKVKNNQIKENFQTGLGCFLALLAVVGPILLLVALPKEIILYIGIIAAVCTLGPYLLALLGFPFVVASELVKKRWHMIVVGIIILVILITLILTIGNIFPDSNYQYLDSHRPDKW